MEIDTHMSKALVLRSRLPEEVLEKIETEYLRPHCLKTIGIFSELWRQDMVRELRRVIAYASHLCHPWEQAPWDWTDEQCLHYFPNVCLHFRRDRRRAVYWPAKP